MLPALFQALLYSPMRQKAPSASSESNVKTDSDRKSDVRFDSVEARSRLCYAMPSLWLSHTCQVPDIPRRIAERGPESEPPPRAFQMPPFAGSFHHKNSYGRPDAGQQE
eukprot:1149402-Rhodomonas_salina.1